MENWFKRMKPKLKNWRWWVALPLILITAIFLLVVVALPAFIFEMLAKMFDNLSYWWSGLQDAKVFNYIRTVIKWSEENE